VRYDDKPLGHTQLLISANDVMSTVLRPKTTPSLSGVENKEMEALRRKAEILSVLYEMSKTLASVFDLRPSSPRRRILFSASLRLTVWSHFWPK
jgi:hypothetical protein